MLCKTILKTPYHFPQVTGFRSYVDMYLKDKVDETGSPLTVVHESVNDRWEVCLTMSEKGFQQVSFVNSIATTKVGAAVSTLNRWCRRAMATIMMALLV